MRKHLLNFCVAALMGTGLLHAQLTQSENYVYSKTHLSKPGDSIQKPPVESVTYIDGLGRPKQSIAIKASPSGKDLVSTVPYDGFGRQMDTWLPTPMPSLSGGIQGGVQSAANTYYNDPRPFSHRVLESSPLDRIQQQIQPGNAWSAKPVTFDYNTNSDTEVYKFITSTTWNNSATLSVLKLAPATDTYSISNKYKANQLYKNVVVDEDGNTTTEFKNGEGQTILVRKNDGVNDVDTYYVYNEYNQLAFVIPPKAVAVTLPALFPVKTNPAISTVLADLCYQYRYDGRGRLVEKKLPGKDWEYMVYDKQDRLVLTQDGKLRTTTNNFGVRGWLFTKYDQWGRVAYTGFFSNTENRLSMQSALNSMTVNPANNEARSATHFTLSGLHIYYSNNAFPSESMTILSVSYYDSYPAGTPFPTQNRVFGEDILLDTYVSGAITTQSLPVATFVKNIDDHQWTKNYSFYDKKGRSIASHSINHLGGSTVQHSRLDFSGMVRKTKTYHKRLSTELPTVIEEIFEYDSQNRLAKHSHEVIGKSTKELLAENTYNETGTLKNKKVGGSGTPLQTVDYQYNIRGWMTGINDPALLGNDLFAYKINYNSPLEGLSYPNINVSSPVMPKYNGNIAEVSWISIADIGLKRYGYIYDKLNRLSAGLYQNPQNPSSRENSEILTYDLNGNIATLQRTAFIVGTVPNVIDNLKYDYTGNRLDRVHDNQGAVANPSGYEGGGRTIGYDVNGNMTDMPDKGISAIQYNYLNLPTVMNAVDEVNTVNIGYLYRADGSKLRKTNTTTVTANTGISTASVTDYLDGFQYLSTTATGGGIAAGTGEFEVAMERESFTAQSATAVTGNAILQFVPTAEGFYDFKENRYIYQYKDHLGNTRLSYVWNTATNSIDVLDKNDYYPFGMNHLNADAGSHFGQGSFKNYKYNGKELQETGMYEYGARFYMADIGRWGVVDPLAEVSRRFSTYAYSFNNPIRFIDPDGRAPLDIIFRMKNTDNKNVDYKYSNGKFYNTSTNKVYAGGNKTLDKVQSTFDKINSSNDVYLKRMVSTLEKSDKTHIIQESQVSRSQALISSDDAYKAYQLGKGVGTGVFLDMDQGNKQADASYLASEKTTNSDGATIVHELKHSYDFDQGYMKGESKVDGAASPAETRSVIMENKYRRIEGSEPRLYYDNVKVDFNNTKPLDEKK